jgi:hypothetical protein
MLAQVFEMADIPYHIAAAAGRGRIFADFYHGGEPSRYLTDGRAILPGVGVAQNGLLSEEVLPN